MKFSCPQCHQNFEAEASLAGQTTECPQCGLTFIVPAPMAMRIPSRPAPAPVTASRPRVAAPRKSNAGSWVVQVIFLGVAGLAFAAWRSGESPAQWWQWLNRWRAQPPQIAAPPVGTPFPEATPAPSATALPTAEPMVAAASAAPVLTAAAEATPISEAEVLSWLGAHRERWPAELTLRAAAELSAMYQGKVVGTVKIPAGHRVKLVAIEDDLLKVSNATSTGVIPLAATDLIAQGRLLLAGAGSSATPSPAPSARAMPEAVAAAPAAPARQSNALDTLIFGNAASENGHALTSKGSAIFQNELTLSGPGNLWDNADVLVLRQQKLEGDGWVQARVISAGEASEWTKVGVMIRDSLEAKAKYAMMFNTNSHGLHAQWRSDTGGSTSQSDALKLPGSAPYWLRIERKGDLFKMSASGDGKAWTEAVTQEIKMGARVYLGLASASGSAEMMNYAIFDQISSSAPKAEWVDSTIGNTSLPGRSMVNGLGEPSRRMLPQQPAYYYGGELSFRIKVDPQRQNYLTAKLWGSDGTDKMGRVILEAEGKEVGVRHGSGLDIFIHNVGAVSPGAFWYRTTILPKWLTKGKTSVQIRLRSVGDLFAYGQPFNYDTYQHKLEQPTRALYRVYSHLDPVLMPGAEVQGKAPDYATAPLRPAVDVGEYLQKLKDDHNRSLTELLQKSDPDQANAAALADGYGVAWTVAYRKPEAAAQIVKALDATCRKYHADNKLAGAEWGGNFGPAGYALSVVAPAIAGPLNEAVDLGAGATPRRAQYAAMLRASVDAGRFNRNSIAAQAIINSYNLYRANRGLLALGAKEALPEEQARGYYRQACGMEEWRGSDLPGGGSDWVYGRGVFMFTTKGTSHEWNWCCANCYGRLDPEVYEMARLTGDAGFRNRAMQIQRAHNYMVYPSVDEDGFRAMLNEGVICTRNVYHPGHSYYGNVNIMAAQADPALLGVARQGLADHQLFSTWQLPYASIYLPDDYEKHKRALAKAGPLPPLPTTPGQPDFAWADEQNAVLSIKHGHDQHFLTFARRSEGGLTRIGDAHSITPQYERVVQFALEDVRYTPTGEFNTLDGKVESDFTGTPPDNPESAFAGQKLPRLKGRAGSPADFYGVRYGDFLIGMNASADKTFEFKPEGFYGGVDMVSGKKLNAPVSVPAQTTVVFYAPEKPAFPR